MTDADPVLKLAIPIPLLPENVLLATVNAPQFIML